MGNLIGEYYCKLDSKGRIMIPSGLKKQLPPEANEQFVVNRGFEKCIALYPKNEWDTITNEISKLNKFNKKNREFQRYFYRGATPLSMDSNGRILIPKGLKNYAGVGHEVVLFAYGDHVEIWDKTTYENLLTDEPEDFANLAEEVMGDKQENQNDNELS
ncbi:MAG: division/cell wall cluster transcriptional repressor MraZ [Bacteroidales bacterium]|nr:division/cell wall cluster transcriptional repressor MraZ [Bacteroidales bacterium]MCF8327208.1 division/cell wall cluster transcriptional repressor MraZ [Bacteroidales bacterium]